MVNEMSLRLEKLVEDIREETILWPIEDATNSREEEAAWAKIGEKYKMTGSHVKSIFKVLSKKYEVEKANRNTDWKLFNYLSFLDEKKEIADNDAEFDADDGEEFVELLEVNEEYCSDDEEPNTSLCSTPEQPMKSSSNEQHQFTSENQVRKLKNNKTVIQEKYDFKNGSIKKLQRNSNENGIKLTATGIQGKNDQITRKSSSPKRVLRIPMALSKNNNISIQEKKMQSTLTPDLKLALKKEEKQKIPIANLKEVKLKRRMENKSADKEDDEDSPPTKRSVILPKGIKVVSSASKASISKSSPSTSLDIQELQRREGTSSCLMPVSSPSDKLPPFSSFLKKSPTAISKDHENKISQQNKTSPKENNEQQGRSNTPVMLRKIKSEITSPSQLNSSGKSLIMNNKINGVDPIRKDFSDKNEAKLKIEQISKDADENTEIKVKVLTEQAEKILPTFFRDLYNSTKYDSFGMYVSSTMNRLSSQLASKLEAKILQSIIEVNAMVDESMENF